MQVNMLVGICSATFARMRVIYISSIGVITGGSRTVRNLGF
jgi:hypothetical protein